jgi:hypothetical protein
VDNSVVFLRIANRERLEQKERENATPRNVLCVVRNASPRHKCNR